MQLPTREATQCTVPCAKLQATFAIKNKKKSGSFRRTCIPIGHAAAVWWHPHGKKACHLYESVCAMWEAVKLIRQGCQKKKATSTSHGTLEERGSCTLRPCHVQSCQADETGLHRKKMEIGNLQRTCMKTADCLSLGSPRAKQPKKPLWRRPLA